MPAGDRFDVAVLGGGPGGYVAALQAAQRGARVVLVEKERIGGTCLNVGCIPTKALTTATELLRRAKVGQGLGLVIPSVAPDLPGLVQYERRVVDELVEGVVHLLHERRVAIREGEGRLVRPGTLLVMGRDGVWTELSAQKVIIAPGSIVAKPRIPGTDLPGVITSTAALSVEQLPRHLAVVGGGVIGLELACIYEALGCQVTILEMAPTLLPGGTDETLAKRLALSLRRRGMTIRTGVVVSGIDERPGGLRVSLAGPSEDGIDADRVLLATGRVPNTDGPALAELGLKLNGRAIAVDESLSTSVADVWAVGDAVGGAMLAHKAMAEGRVAAENATGGTRRMDYRSVPNVVFTWPEVASVGLTEAQARASGAKVKISQCPLSANPRARIHGEADGQVKLVCEAESGRVLGVHIMGPHATDLIAEGALAVQLGATADDLAWTTHAHPTLPEAVLEAALGFRDGAIHFHSRGRSK